MGTSVFERPIVINKPEEIEKLLEIMSRTPKEPITYHGGYETTNTEKGKEMLRRWLEAFENSHKDE